MAKKSINDPESPFPQGQEPEPADAAKAPKGKARPETLDDLAKFEKFASSLPQAGGDSPGFSAPAPDQIEAKAKAAGMNADQIAKLIEMVTTFGPQIIGAVQAFIAMFRKKTA
jgi:hypothetical protein